MKTNILTTLVAFFIITSIFSQENLNEYKYILVKKQFSFLKNENQYRINSLAKFLFNKYGFVTFMEGDAYPSDFFDDRCSALKADIVEEKGWFKTKLKTILINCNDQVIYTSNIGESREKEFSKAYNEAVRNSFKSIEKLNYKYTPKKGPIKTTKKAILKNETQILNEDKATNVAKKMDSTKQNLTEGVKEDVNQTRDVTPTPHTTSLKTQTTVLYAQQVKSGYQLVDRTPKVVFKIKSTGLTNVYLIENKQGIIYKKGDQWFSEYYENNTLKQDVLNIKF